MQTPTILTQTNAPSGPTPAAKQISAPERPFNQMLTQQMADRRSANHANNASKAPDARKSGEANKSKEPSKANAANAENNSQSSTPATSTTDTKSATAEKSQEVAENIKVDSSTVDPISPELLAFMASNPSTAVAANNGVSPRLDERAVLTTAVQGDLSEGADLKALSEKGSAIGKDAHLKESADFAATMTAVGQAANAKESLQLASAKMQNPLSAVSTAGMPQLQQVAFDIAPTTGQPTEKLSPHVGTPAWDQAIGQKVVWMVAGAQQSASLTLNPPDLGPLQVVLKVTNGQADASFIASQPEVRQALEAALPKLREMMTEAGIELGQTSISAGTPNQQNQPGEQAQHNGRHGGTAGNSSEAASRVTGTTKVTSGQGLVDTFA